ncbi:MAG: hypothetical protein AAFX96_12560, partial [Pseudomonadota bacterium]
MTIEPRDESTLIGENVSSPTASLFDDKALASDTALKLFSNLQTKDIFVGLGPEKPASNNTVFVEAVSFSQAGPDSAGDLRVESTPLMTPVSEVSRG